MKRILTLVSIILLSNQYIWSQCSGLQIAGFNSDNPDQILLLATSDISGSTVFYITDNEWNGTSFNTGEGTLTWTTPVAGILSGSKILLEGTTASCGTISGNTTAFSTTDDEIYITSVSPVGNVAEANICFAVKFGDATSVATLPANSINLGNTDNAVYNSGSITTLSSWTTSNNIVTLTGSCSSAILAAELKNIKVSKKNASAELSWQTATENNNSHFDIERSNDGVKFSKLEAVKGHGTTNIVQDYTFTDDAPLKNINYYRLRQVDFDGKETISKTVSINFDGKGQGKAKVYPTLVKDVVNIELSQDTKAEISVRDLTGRVVLTQNTEGGTNAVLNLSSLNSGMYLLSIRSNEGVETVKIQKY